MTKSKNIDISASNLLVVKSILSTLLEDNVPIWIFGSRINGEATVYSDFDVVVVDEKRLPVEQYYQLKDAFEYSILPFKVDFLDWHRVRHEFQKNIQKSYIVLR